MTQSEDILDKLHNKEHLFCVSDISKEKVFVAGVNFKQYMTDLKKKLKLAAVAASSQHRSEIYLFRVLQARVQL